MVIAALLALWIVGSVLLATLWVLYRGRVGTHGLEDFDVPFEAGPRSTVFR